MKLPSLVEGIFLKRVSRFSADIEIGGKVTRAYVPNSGRMKELLIQGSKVFLSRSVKEERITNYDLLLVDYEGTLVSVDSRVPNLLVMEMLRGGKIQFHKGPAVQEIQEVKKEVSFLNSRFDFRVTARDKKTDINQQIFIEAKSVTLVREGTAMFPDAPTERGARHLTELAVAIREGHQGIVIFIVQRPDAVGFRPNNGTDPVFAEAFWSTIDQGVKPLVYSCKVSTTEIVVDRELPLIGG